MRDGGFAGLSHTEETRGSLCASGWLPQIVLCLFTADNNLATQEQQAFRTSGRETDLFTAVSIEKSDSVWAQLVLADRKNRIGADKFNRRI